MERKIGEIFEYNGEWYQCVKSDGTCNGCVGKFLPYSFCNGSKECVGKIFKKLEKVGEPYMTGNKLIQRYKIYPTTCCINVYGWYYQNLDVKSWTIDIELKQNKEDMEEKKQKIDDLVGLYSSGKITYKELDKELKALYDKEESEPTLKEFDLEAAKQGKPVCTRDGRKARIICFDKITCKNYEELKIIALVREKDNEDIHVYNNNGKKYLEDSPIDLMMLPEKKEGWVNIYYEHDAPSHREASWVYDKEEEAIKVGKEHGRCYIATVRIEWEE